MILFFYGEDTFRLKQKLKALKEKFISSSLGDTNLVVLSGKTVSFSEISRQILAMPFLSRKRLVILENLLKEGKKETQEKVIDFIKKVPDSTVLVFIEEGNPDRRTSLFKKINLPGKAEEFKLLEGEGLRRWIKKKAETYGGEIEKEAVDRLVEYVGSDLWRLSSEIAKLASYKLPITPQNVELMVVSKAESNIFGLVEALAGKASKRATAELYKLFYDGQAEIYILTMIVWQYRNLLIIKDIEERFPGISRWDLQSKTKLSPFVLGKSLNLAKLYNLEDLKNIYSKLLDFDERIKTGKIESKLALELLVFELTR